MRISPCMCQARVYLAVSLAMERAALDDLFDGLGQIRIGHRADWSRPPARRPVSQCLRCLFQMTVHGGTAHLPNLAHPFHAIRFFLTGRDDETHRLDL